MNNNNKKYRRTHEDLYIHRDLSWLSFNERVLQEATDPNVPVLEKLKFLSIFSSNLDEFFRVRVANIRRLIRIEQANKNANEVQYQKKLLNKIQYIVVKQQERFRRSYEFVKEQLAENKIYIIDELELNNEQKVAVRSYFKAEVLSSLFPIILDHLRDFPFLRDRSAYLAIKMSKKNASIRNKFALIEVPTETLPRFYVLPKSDSYTYIILLEDVIRTSMDLIFSSFDFDTFESHVVKLTRDQELTIDNDEKTSIIEKISKGLKKRDKGAPVRLVYDNNIPYDLLQFIIKKIKLNKESLIPGGRYHNFKDFWNFPTVGPPEFKYPSLPAIPISAFENQRQMFDAISQKDFLLHHPYHSFDYVIRFLREAAVDPSVNAIKITLYRLAKHSNVANALINALRNGKKVTAVVELKARFDEESNIYWANRLQDEGATLIYGIPDLKIHSKVCLIYRREHNKIVHYAHLSTGNYNGITSRSYSDLAIFTKDKRLTADLVKVFNLIPNFSKVSYKFRHLLVSPLSMKSGFLKLIDNEIRNVKKGKKAFIIAKVNSLSDEGIIDKLYEASQAGVQVKLIVRGICCLKPGIKNISENIQVVSIIDRFLEHARVFIFANGGMEKYYLGSADFMSRNLDRRIEVAFPVYDPTIKKQLRDIIFLQLSDKVKARIIDAKQQNNYVPFALPPVRAQVDTYNYLLENS